MGGHRQGSCIPDSRQEGPDEGFGPAGNPSDGRKRAVDQEHIAFPHPEGAQIGEKGIDGEGAAEGLVGSRDDVSFFHGDPNSGSKKRAASALTAAAPFL